MRTIPDAHIFVGQGPSGKMALMLRNIPGPVIVMYSAAQCSACNQLRPVLQRLESTHSEIAFVEVPNVTRRKRFVVESRKTSTPITETPMLVMYAEGQPVGVYRGQTRTVQDIDGFIRDVMRYVLDRGLLVGARPGGVSTGLSMPSTTDGGAGMGGMGGIGVPGGVAQQPGGGYAVMGGIVDEAPEEGAWVPAQIKAHNQPWTGYKMFG